MNFVHFLFAVAYLQKERGGAVGIVDMCEEFGLKRGTANMYLKALKDCGYIVRVRRGKYMLCSNTETRAFGLLVVTPMDVYIDSSAQLKAQRER